MKHPTPLPAASPIYPGTTRTMHPLEHKIPPPALMIVVGAAMWFTARYAPSLPIGPFWPLALGGGFAVLGLFISGAGVLAFRQARTTIDPLQIQRASSVVTHGVYRWTRNPMYVGMAMVLLGWGIYLAAPMELLGPVGFVLFITRFQVIPEERVLGAKFGQPYEAFKQRVRRWL